jgi:hypothetical protein
LGGVTAGVLCAFRGENILRGIVAGLSGGALDYAGKRIVVQPFDGAGLLGRQVASFGNSIIRNASDARPLLDEVILTLGPIPGRLIVTPSRATKVRPVVDLVSFGGMVYGLVDSRYSFQWGASWSSGAAVFLDRTPLGPAAFSAITNSDPNAGVAVGSNIYLTRYAVLDPSTLPHERVHVLQFDFLAAAWGDRLDTAIMSERAAGLDRYVKLNLLPATLGLINRAIVFPSERDGLPWEIEAHSLATRALDP